MGNLLQDIKDDIRFVRSHSLQPAWYKAAKVFILLGVILGYWLLFGPRKTAIFLGAFLVLSLLLHLLYRVKTRAWTESWLDFIVTEEQGEVRPRSIGPFYYFAIALNATVSVVLSQLL